MLFVLCGLLFFRFDILDVLWLSYAITLGFMLLIERLILVVICCFGLFSFAMFAHIELILWCVLISGFLGLVWMFCDCIWFEWLFCFVEFV